MFTALAALSTIALMGFFAWKNHREGWVKPRKPMIENLRDADWNAHYDVSTVREVAVTSSAWPAGTAINPKAFSQQLERMETSLERLNAPVVKANRASAAAAPAKAADWDKMTVGAQRLP
jgi:hypothetical protein